MVPALEEYLALYGLLALTHLVVQTVLGHLEHRRQSRTEREPEYGGYRPSVSVVVPVYNENPETLRCCLDSLTGQTYPRLDVIVVDDGSPNQEELLALYDEYAKDSFRIVLRAYNAGKREAQCVAFDLTDAEVVVTVDSDTVLASQDAVLRLVQRLADERVGAVTGAVGVTNRRENLLTRLIAYRYWSAFHQERAAQSLFGVVACCSGPFAAYRATVLKRVRGAYTSQRFCGEVCTFGDDRHLTNLVLAEGHEVVFDERARAHTAAPTQLKVFLRQQVRWTKSFYREILWTARFAHRRHPYLMVDMTFQTLLPVMLLTAAGGILYHALTHDPEAIVRYAAVVAAVGTARALYGMARTGDPGFLLFVVYGFLHMFVLKPMGVYALLTMRRTHWGTRTASSPVSLKHESHILPDAICPFLVRQLDADLYSVDPHAVARSMVHRHRLASALRNTLPGPPSSVELGAGPVSPGEARARALYAANPGLVTPS